MKYISPNRLTTNIDMTEAIQTANNVQTSH